ncbi:MAG: ATP-dependent RecD-like DNA helicase [Lachnospiraceae bacterium]|nr:ATP-dependent RecD-like DNA helicase [Lachnospiraceae bacterium]
MARVTGTVEHVIHRNAENGYSVVEIAEEKGLLTLVGILPELQPGEPIEAEGSFVAHPVYGEQLAVEHFTLLMPSDAIAVEKYLASGIIKGIGPALAGRIVKRFGADALRVMEEQPEELAKVKGISKNGARLIQEQVAAKREMREAMMFLEQFGISIPLAVKIYEKYGQTLYSVIKTNPYKLMDDITHVGFRIADEIAVRAGLPADSEFRIRSGVNYAMQQALQAGHIYLPRETLISYAARLLELDEDLIENAVTDLTVDKRLVQRMAGGVHAVYLAKYYYMEAAVAAMLTALDRPLHIEGNTVEEELWHILGEGEITLEDMQQDAVLRAVKNGLTVITGGPGTGKTTTISALIRYFDAKGLSIELAAPTGRAAKRITEATGRDARTIHRLLEFMGSPEDNENDTPHFQRNESNPIEADVVIIDEVSMVDLPLMYALLKAIIPGTRLVLVGDANQLPSVGPGNVLRDVIASGVVDTIELTRIFRQAETSDIVLNAHRINRGEEIVPDKTSRDFMVLRRNNAAEIQQAVIRLIRDKLPPYVHADPFEIQVITPVRKGVLGVENLNRILQDALNPPAEYKKERQFAHSLFRVGDKVMQIKNNYQKEWSKTGGTGFSLKEGTGVFNGDLGIVKDIRFFSEELVVLFDDDREAVYLFSEADELELAYAVTVHKSQGSEYPAVILPLLSVPLPLMTRNLIYTAVTRAKSCVVVVGLWETFLRMASNDTEQKRYSSLAEQLREIRERTERFRM